VREDGGGQIIACWGGCHVVPPAALQHALGSLEELLLTSVTHPPSSSFPRTLASSSLSLSERARKTPSWIRLARGHARRHDRRPPPGHGRATGRPPGTSPTRPPRRRRRPTQAPPYLTEASR
jgi:hypothetical protein